MSEMGISVISLGISAMKNCLMQWEAWWPFDGKEIS